jgi:hypothetical protein
MIRCNVKGDFKKTKKFLKRSEHIDFESLLKQYAEEGVTALKSATPVITGKTAESWGYEISRSRNKISIYWTNSNKNDGVPIAVILEYGHGTGWGGYVQGRRFISPAIQPVFDSIANSLWKEVTSN